MLSLVEELDDEVRTQKEYFEKRFLEELTEDLEDQILLHDIKIYSLTKPDTKERCTDDPKRMLSKY